MSQKVTGRAGVYFNLANGISYENYATLIEGKYKDSYSPIAIHDRY